MLISSSYSSPARYRNRRVTELEVLNIHRNDTYDSSVYDTYTVQYVGRCCVREMAQLSLVDLTSRDVDI